MTHPPEIWDLLRQLLAATWEPDGVALSPLLPWTEILDLARSQGTIPLIRSAAAKLGLAVPPEIQTEMDTAYFATARDNTLRLRELAEVLAAFTQAGVPVLVLKGTALADTIYDNIALRPMGDVDLLIPREAVPACRKALLERGYTSTEVEMAPGTQVQYRNQQAFLRQHPFPVAIELHWHIIDVPYYMRRVPVDWIWERSITHQLEGQSVRILTPEVELLYLTAHLAFHHRFHGLRWFVDLAWLIRHHADRLDWASLTATAAQFEWLYVVRETIDRLAAQWPSLPLDQARLQLHAGQATNMEHRIFRLLTTEPRTPLLDFYGDLVCLPSLAARIRFGWINLFPQSTYMKKRYDISNRWTLPYWYLHRLAVGLWKAIRTLPQALRLGTRRDC